VLTLWLTSVLALSAETARAEASVAKGPAPTAVAGSEVDYRLPLALGYLLPVSLVVGVSVFAPSSPGAYVAGTVGVVGIFAAPPLVHAAYGNGAGALTSIFGSVGFVGVGLVLGAGASYALGHPEKHCDEDERSAGSVCAIGTAFILGGLVGAGVGYSIWGVLDTVLDAHTREPSTARRAGLKILPAWAPLLAGERASRRTLQGVSLGLVATF
jgi:hypothetical protein